MLILHQPLWSDTQKLDAATVLVGVPKGGDGGGPFDMRNNIGDPYKASLKAIIVRSGSKIDAIQASDYHSIDVALVI